MQFSELLPDGGHASLRDVEFDDLRLSTRKNIENMCTYNDDAKLLFEEGHEAAREHVEQLSEAERAASGWTDRAGAYDPSSADASLIRQLIFWGKEAGMINSETNDDEIVKAFYASALGDRDKVTARSDYVIRTVGKFLEIDPQ